MPKIKNRPEKDGFLSFIMKKLLRRNRESYNRMVSELNLNPG